MVHFMSIVLDAYCVSFFISICQSFGNKETLDTLWAVFFSQNPVPQFRDQKQRDINVMAIMLPNSPVFFEPSTFPHNNL